MFWYFRKQHATRAVMMTLREVRMPKKRPDKQQNQEKPPLSLERGMPQPAPVDHEAFARRAGEIIGNSNTSLHKARDAGGNKRPRRSG
jgi:hypothetical protein